MNIYDNSIEYKIKVMEAFRDGKKIQSLVKEYWCWRNPTWRDEVNPVWDWERYYFCIKDVKEIVTFTFATMPFPCLLRCKNRKDIEYLVCCKNNSGAFIGEDKYFSYDELAKHWEWMDIVDWSRDRSKEWLPCYRLDV